MKSSSLETTRKPWLRRYSGTGQYILWFKYHSKRHQYKLDTTDYETAVVKAEAEIAKIKAEASAAPLVKDGKATFSEVLEHFLLALQKQVQSKEMKPGSYEFVDEGAKKIRRERPDWLERPAAKITFMEFDDYAAKLKASQSPTTSNRVISTIKRAYALAVEEGFLRENPTAKVKRAKTKGIKGMKTDDIPTEDQYQQLLASIRDSKVGAKWLIIDSMEFLSNFGCRIKEARNILKSHVDLKGRTIKIVGDPDPNIRTKNGSVRFIPIFEHTVPLIERMLARDNTFKPDRQDYLLPIKKWNRGVNHRAKQLGIPVHGHHWCRHLCATRWIEMGVSIKHVAKWLGHRDGGTLALQVYTKARDSQDKFEAAKVRGTIAPGKQPANVVPMTTATGSAGPLPASAHEPTAAIHPAKSA